MKSKTKKQTAFFFKILREDRTAPYVPQFKWPKNGVWTNPIRGELQACFNGYHLIRPRNLDCWLQNKNPPRGYRLFLVEAETEGMLQSINKVVVRRARIVKRISVSRALLGDKVWNGRALITKRKIGDLMQKEWNIVPKWRRTKSQSGKK